MKYFISPGKSGNKLAAYWIISFFYILSASPGYSQGKVRYFFHDQCTDSIKMLEYGLIDLSSLRTFNAVNGEIILDTSALLTLYAKMDRGGTTVSINGLNWYDQNSFYLDTIDFPKLVSVLPPLHPEYTYYNFCNQLAQGRIIEYHPNGKIRMKGLFNNGLAISSLRYYNRRGKLVFRYNYNNGEFISSKIKKRYRSPYYK